MGLSAADSEALLDELWHYGTLPENHWHQQWQVGDMMVWDNRCAMHRRAPFPGTERRRMDGIVVMGSEPICGVSRRGSRGQIPASSMPAAASNATTAQEGAFQTARSTKPVSARAKSRGSRTALVHTGS